MPVDVGETEVTPLEAVGQLLVIESQLVENRGLEVVHVNRFLGDGETEFVGCSVVEPAFYAASRHPHREGVGKVIASEDF